MSERRDTRFCWHETMLTSDGGMVIPSSVIITPSFAKWHTENVNNDVQYSASQICFITNISGECSSRTFFEILERDDVRLLSFQDVVRVLGAHYREKKTYFMYVGSCPNDEYVVVCLKVSQSTKQREVYVQHITHRVQWRRLTFLVIVRV